jgi:hypothetical protein
MEGWYLIVVGLKGIFDCSMTILVKILRSRNFYFVKGFACKLDYEYFLQKRDAAGKLGFSSIQKVTAAMRMMAYGCSTDSIDKYTQMGMFLTFLLTEIYFNFDVAFLLKPRAPHLNA